MTSKAAEKRYEAMRTLNLSIVTSGPRHRMVGSGVVTEIVNTWICKDRAEVAAKIRALAPLGRTDRWRNAVELWAVAVETEQSELDFSEWAFFQYGIWCGYAAE